jgi:hypothetical protein
MKKNGEERQIYLLKRTADAASRQRAFVIDNRDQIRLRLSSHGCNVSPANDGTIMRWYEACDTG